MNEYRRMPPRFACTSATIAVDPFKMLTLKDHPQFLVPARFAYPCSHNLPVINNMHEILIDNLGTRGEMFISAT
jgi:hypothetical protein